MSGFVRRTAPNGVVYLTSGLLPCRHGFASRAGGVSTLPHTASLNLAFGRGDGDETVRENLRRFAEAVGFEPGSVVSRHQIHSTRVIDATDDMAGEGYFRPTDEGCDGFVTTSRRVTLGVKTADCVPILFYGCAPDGSAPVIGAVHAGWRGTAAGIAGECVERMCALGASRESIRAAVGPSIRFCCYEVGDDFFESVRQLVGTETAERFIYPVSGEGSRLHADLVGLNRQILMEHGLSPERIDVSEDCTCCHPESYFSHRYSKGLRGTMLSVITLA